MAIVDDKMKEDLDYSSLLDSLNFNLNGETPPSIEDVHWADSCLNKDLDSSNADWSSVKDALLEILVSQQGPSSSAVAECSGKLSADEIFHSMDNASSFRGPDVDDDLGYEDLGECKELSEDEVEEEEEPIFGNELGRLKRKKHAGSVFRPNYREDTVTDEKNDYDLGLCLTNYAVEPSSEDIFKIWDLGVSDEPDDFTKQLNGALAEIPPQKQLAFDDSTSWNGFENASVDDIIAGVGGLSLTRSTT